VYVPELADIIVMALLAVGGGAEDPFQIKGKPGVNSHPEGRLIVATKDTESFSHKVFSLLYEREGIHWG